MKHFSLFFFFVFLFFKVEIAFGQKKSVQAIRVTENIVVDGKLNESSWDKAPIAKDFVMYEPDNGALEKNEKRSEVKIIFNDNGIYIGATLYDNEITKIEKEITQRDNFGTADIFGIFLNGFNDGQQDFRFFVTAAGVQLDCLATENGEDFSWDAIWNSEISLTDFGWVVEMEIPYAALRFSKNDKQIWGLNIFREIRGRCINKDQIPTIVTIRFESLLKGRTREVCI
jgi:hypothetical protein